MNADSMGPIESRVFPVSLVRWPDAIESRGYCTSAKMTPILVERIVQATEDAIGEPIRFHSANALLCARAVTDRMEHHFARQHQPHRPAYLSSSSCRKRTQGPWPQFASKTGAHEFCDHTDLLDWQAEHLCQDTPEVDHSLRRFIQRKSLSLPYRGS